MMNQESLEKMGDEDTSSRPLDKREVRQTESETGHRKEPQQEPLYSTPSQTETGEPEKEEKADTKLVIDDSLYGVSKPKRRVIKGRIYHDED